MSHFEREAKINFWMGLAPILIGLLMGVLGFFAFRVIDMVRIDRCLDRGGSYNYDAGECDFSVSHPSPNKAPASTQETRFSGSSRSAP